MRAATLVKNGKTAAGTQRWTCQQCGAHQGGAEKITSTSEIYHQIQVDGNCLSSNWCCLILLNDDTVIAWQADEREKTGHERHRDDQANIEIVINRRTTGSSTASMVMALSAAASSPRWPVRQWEGAATPAEPVGRSSDAIARSVHLATGSAAKSRRPMLAPGSGHRPCQSCPSPQRSRAT